MVGLATLVTAFVAATHVPFAARVGHASAAADATWLDNVARFVQQLDKSGYAYESGLVDISRREPALLRERIIQRDVGESSVARHRFKAAGTGAAAEQLSHVAPA